MFTTRPELSGSFGMVTSTHWIASAVGMRLLEMGGNAFDAAAATGFTLNVVEPHLNGPLGDLPILIKPHGDDKPKVICGQGTAPAGATLDHYRSEGLDLVPGSGLLATVVPGAFDAWMLMLRDHGQSPLRYVLEPAIHYAEFGHPMLPRVADTISGIADFFRDEWPTSAAVWLPGGQPPKAGTRFRNPDLAAFWTRLLAEAETVSGRDAQIERARVVFREGFVAEAIDGYLRTAEVMDATGHRRAGVLTGADMAGWEASYESPLSVRYGDSEVYKCGFWSQGPVLLQTLQQLSDDSIGDLDPNGADFVHLVAESLKLALADRDAFYGDPAAASFDQTMLLSQDYARARRQLIGDAASRTQQPGALPGTEALGRESLARLGREAVAGDGPGTGEPTMSHLITPKADTVHIDVIDRWGNAVSATPSGGWLQSNPVIPGLGVPLNTRAQMFWLDGTGPALLAPGRRPRTTLSPSMARRDDGTWLAFGTPGGDQQDQWQAIFLLRHMHHGLNMQAAIDAPLFHTGHMQASFYPRQFRQRHLMVEPGFGDTVIDALRARGHVLEVAEPWSVGRLTAARRESDGALYAAATPRLVQAYAVGR